MTVAQLEFEKTLAGLPVLVTGHTGFTGGWLCLWLKSLGCSITGLALAPETRPNLFDDAHIEKDVVSLIGDIRDFDTVRRAFETSNPAVVFHLAAQPLVGRAFENPCETIATNVLGTAHVLEAARHTESVKALVCVTTDKVYADESKPDGYQEDDRLGGKDPYSASKACAELVTASYIATLNARGNGARMATARGGNIIGGGDWSAQRIVPDFMRALQSGESLTLRNPNAVRPWQHVLALVQGYKMLAARLLQNEPLGPAWNFGPMPGDAQPVSALVAALARFGNAPKIEIGAGTFPETQDLRLDSRQARDKLGWNPPVNFLETAQFTAEWYGDYLHNPKNARSFTLRQIETYRAKLAAA